jgi:hypothetical protein
LKQIKLPTNKVPKDLLKLHGTKSAYMAIWEKFLRPKHKGNTPYTGDSVRTNPALHPTSPPTSSELYPVLFPLQWVPCSSLSISGPPQVSRLGLHAIFPMGSPYLPVSLTLQLRSTLLRNKLWGCEPGTASTCRVQPGLRAWWLPLPMFSPPLGGPDAHPHSRYLS